MNTVSEDPKEEYRRRFAEDFSYLWEVTGSPRMIGRVLGYLLIMDRPHISSADLAQSLQISSGAVSMATQKLIETRFIRRYSIPGDRKRYFAAEQDPWGSFLANEQKHFQREIEVIDGAMEWLDPDAEPARRRLLNGRDYLRWIQDYHHKMLRDWEAHKRLRDGGKTEEPHE